jgi:hypothetical protein
MMFNNPFRAFVTLNLTIMEITFQSNVSESNKLKIKNNKFILFSVVCHVFK